MTTTDLSEADITLVVNDVLDLYGYDFSGYSRASLKRRITRLMLLDRFPSFAEFRYRLRSDITYLTHFVEQVTVNVTEMFRDVPFFKALRQKVIPILATYPLIRIWHAGCASGEEVYSMAILLQEYGLLSRTLLYATDLNPESLETARTGIYRLGHMKQYAENYNLSGGTQQFSDYFVAHYDYAKMDERLTKRMIFSTHNLVSDGSFNEFQLILCRNVLIYFDKDLQNKVLGLLDGSLDRLGFLALGSKETIRFSDIAANYTQPWPDRIWRKKQ